jgi:hypothetical protein
MPEDFDRRLADVYAELMKSSLKSRDDAAREYNRAVSLTQL